jgi:hypothetical protein
VVILKLPNLQLSALMIDIFQRYTLKPTRLKCFGVDAICLRLFADDYL